MSRYVFIAAAALFAGLMLVLAFALAQRDARFSHSLNVETQPDYADQLVSPIEVHKAAIETYETPLGNDDDTPEAQLASYVEPIAEDDQATQVPTRRTLAEPPRFDASRIVSRRASEPAAGPALLPSTSSLRTAQPSPTPPPPTQPLPSSPSTGLPAISSTDLPAMPTTGISAMPSSDLPAMPSSGIPSMTSSSTGASSLPALPKAVVEGSTARMSDEPAFNESSKPNPFPTAGQLSKTSLPAGPTSEPNAPLPSIGSSNSSSPFSNASNPPANSSAPPVATFGAPRDIRNPEPPATSTRGMPAAEPKPAWNSNSAPPEVRKGTWSLSSGAPGSRQFDGSQNPSLEIHKRAPSEVQVGIPATFTAIVRNVGNATAFEVQVLDAVPRGAKLIRTVPEADAFGNDGLVWNLGELAAGQETSISMELIPESEGEIGSVASVKFAAQASVRTMSTLPKLSVKQVAPSEVLGGETLTILVEVANTGTGTARDVQLEEDVPLSLRHATGAKSLGLAVGDLSPGESQRFEIELSAIDAGRAANVVRATAQNATMNESSLPIEVKAPKLQLQLVGPRIRYLERPTSFEAVVENQGTAVARDLYIVAYLPRGLQFNSANNEGTYLPDQHAIAWNLAELAAGTRAKTEFTLLPVEEGRFVIRMTSDAEGLRAESMEREVQVEGQSELTFDIDDDHDPIETNGVTTYTVQVTNIGTRPDQDVQLLLEMPEGAALEQASAPMKYQVQGRSIAFAPLPSMGPKERVLVKVAVRHAREGTQILRASLKSSLRSVPVLKDESTQVYVDR